jgi:tRNA dimethylallyltransferase
MSTPCVYLLLGPTASGKSNVALELARRRGAELLSVDSMKIYRRLDIGTAKPTAAERAAVPHHLIDWKEPWESCSVAEWLSEAERIIRDAAARGVPLVAEGGTALYLMALREGLYPCPGRDAAVRQKLEEQAEREGLSVLYTRLQAVDPDAARRILPSDLRRTVRALEVFELSGRPISAQQVQWGQFRSDIHFHVAGLELDRKVLYARIGRMLDAGWLDECRALLELERPLSREARAALGYKVLFAHLRGEIDLPAAVERICFDTHHFARHQLTWYRKFTDVQWVPVQPDDSAAAIADRVEAVWA